MAPADWTIGALRAGAAFAMALFLSAIVLDAIGSDLAGRAAILGVVAIIATPAISLAATALETWKRDRPVAILAIAVLGVLTVAVALALVLGG